MFFEEALKLARRPASEYLLGWSAKEAVMDAALDVVAAALHIPQKPSNAHRFLTPGWVELDTKMSLFLAAVEAAK